MSIVAGDFSEAVARFAAKKKEAVRHSRRSKKAHATFGAAVVAMSRKKVGVRTSTFSGDSVSLIGAVFEAPIRRYRQRAGAGPFFSRAFSAQPSAVFHSACCALASACLSSNRSAKTDDHVAGKISDSFRRGWTLVCRSGHSLSKFRTRERRRSIACVSRRFLERHRNDRGCRKEDCSVAARGRCRRSSNRFRHSRKMKVKEPNQPLQRNASTGSVSNLESPARRG